MNIKFFRLPETMTPQARAAWRVSMIFMPAEFFILGYVIYQLNREPVWQLWVLLAMVLIRITSEFFSFRLILRNRPEQGIWVGFLPWLLILTSISFLFSGLGLAMFLTAVIVITLIAGQTLSSRSASYFIIASIVMGLIGLLADLTVPYARIELAGFQTVVTYIVGALVVAYSLITLRQFRDYSLRTKLIVVVVSTVLASVGAQAFITNRSITANLEADEDNLLLSSAEQTASNLDDHIASELTSVRSATLITDFEKFLSTPVSERDERLTQETSLTLTNLIKRDPIYIKSYSLISKQGIDVLDTNSDVVGSRHSTEDYFTHAIETGVPYVSPVKFKADGSSVLYFSCPVYNADGQIAGVLMAAYDATILQKWLVQTNQLAGPQSFPILLDENHLRLAHGTALNLIYKTVVPMDEARFAELQVAGRIPNLPIDQLSTNLPDFENALLTAGATETFTTALEAVTNDTNAGALARMRSQPWIVTYFEPTSVYLAPAQAQTRTSMLFAVIITLVMAMVGVGVAQVLSNPIVRLTQAADQIAAGDLNAQAIIESKDETGRLASSFNQMTSQLRDFIGTLEERVEARTKDLATVAEVGTAASSIQDSQRLLQEVVDLSKERFNLYHSHIYLLDEEGKNLVLAAGAGEPGRQMVAEGRSIPLDREQSLVARAARERKGVSVNDVTQEAGFLPNPLLPDTHSELAVPMVVGTNLIGVFDIQSEQIGRFSEADINIQTTLAAQVATSIQNVRSFERARAQAELESLVNTIGQKIQRATTVEDTLQIVARELGSTLGASRVAVNIQASSDGGSGVN